MIRVIDNFWRNHLSIMDYLRQGIHLRGYIQKDPKTEYKRESFILFLNMLKSIKHETIRVLSSINTKSVIKCQDLSKKDI